MKSTLNKTNDVNGTIVIELEKTDYQEKVDKSVSQYRQKANIPGFRQGKVPKSLIRKLYGKAILVDEINKIISDELHKFISDNKIKILGEPLPADNLDEELDLENDEILSFSFDVALTPEFDLKLDKGVELTYYNVKLEPENLEQRVENYRQYNGTYFSVDEEIQGTDMVKGTLVEMDGDKEKEDGQVIENAVLMPTYLKDEEIKNQFIGAKTGDKIVFNPKKAYDNNEAEIASLLQTTKEGVADIDSDFRFDINEVTRFKNAELDQDLFDKVFGEGVVTTKEEFSNKIEEETSLQFKPHVDHFFLHDARDLILKMMEDVEFPVETLKRWLLAMNEKQTEEDIEKDFPAILKDLKFQIAKQKIIDNNEIKVEFSDIEAIAKETAKIQFAQYGMNHLPDDILQNYVKNLLGKEENVRGLYEKASENKIIDWLKENVTLIEKEITSKDFTELVNNHSHDEQSNANAHTHDEHGNTTDNEEKTAQEGDIQEVTVETNSPGSDDVADLAEEEGSTLKPEKKRKTPTKK